MHTPFDNAVFDLYKTKDVLSSGVKQNRKTCSFCKTELEDYEDTYFVGCPACYNAFNEEITQACISVHGRAKHIGKVPQKYNSLAGKQAQIQGLEIQEQKAVDLRNYKLADQIKQKREKLLGEIYGH